MSDWKEELAEYLADREANGEAYSSWKDKPWRPKDVYRKNRLNNWLRDKLLEHIVEEMRQFSPVDFMTKPVDKGDNND